MFWKTPDRGVLSSISSGVLAIVPDDVEVEGIATIMGGRWRTAPLGSEGPRRGFVMCSSSASPNTSIVSSTKQQKSQGYKKVSQ